MDMWPLVILAGIVVGLLCWPKGPKRTLAQQSEDYNRQYYADKKPRRHR